MPLSTPVGTMVPLSYAQEQMWALYEVDHQSSAYSVPIALWFRGSLLSDGVVQALYAVATIQHSLRTCYGYDDGGVPVQWVVPIEEWEPAVQLCTVDCMSEGKAIQYQDESRPHDLQFGVARLTVVRVVDASLAMDGDLRHLLVINVHHIATDYASPLLEQMSQAYNALLRHQDPELTKPAVQYTDYAIWQRRLFESGSRLEDQLQWWESALGSDLPVLELHSDYPRPSALSSRGGHVSVALNTKDLVSTCRKYQATEMHAVLALWSVLLCEHTGQEKVVVGSPFENRARSEVQGVVGYFDNMLTLTVDVPKGANFGDILGCASRGVMSALEHGEAPFLKVVEMLNKSRKASGAPLFQTMVVWTRLEKSLPEFAGGKPELCEVTRLSLLPRI